MTTADPSPEDLGRVFASKRTWLFGDCDAAVETASERLASVARDRGGEKVNFAEEEGGGPGQNRTADTRIFSPKKR
jgi:hypothetical protein